MTKDTYYEMCELLGNEVVESEIPVDLSDFPTEIQTCFHIYGLLSDIWEPMSGSYLGKDFANIFEYFRLYGIEPCEQLFAISVIKSIDGARSSVISQKQKAKQAAAANSNKPR